MGGATTNRISEMNIARTRQSRTSTVLKFPEGTRNSLNPFDWVENRQEDMEELQRQIHFLREKCSKLEREKKNLEEEFQKKCMAMENEKQKEISKRTRALEVLDVELQQPLAEELVKLEKIVSTRKIQITNKAAHGEGTSSQYLNTDLVDVSKDEREIHVTARRQMTNDCRMTCLESQQTSAAHFNVEEKERQLRETLLQKDSEIIQLRITLDQEKEYIQKKMNLFAETLSKNMEMVLLEKDNMITDLKTELSMLKNKDEMKMMEKLDATETMFQEQIGNLREEFLRHQMMGDSKERNSPQNSREMREKCENPVLLWRQISKEQLGSKHYLRDCVSRCQWSESDDDVSQDLQNAKDDKSR